MQLQIDAASAVPIYTQVVEQVQRLVSRRALRAGDRLPSVREMAIELRINRNTAAKAYQLLEAQGYLETRAGDGTYVAVGAPQMSLRDREREIARSLDRLVAEARDLGLTPERLASLLAIRLAAEPAAPTAGGKA